MSACDVCEEKIPDGEGVGCERCGRWCCERCCQHEDDHGAPLCDECASEL